MARGIGPYATGIEAGSMAKYTVSFSCGHSDEIQLLGPEAERQRKIAWFGRSGTCVACRRADKAADLAALEGEHGLPALTGSDQQISWARDLRAAKVAQIVAQGDAAMAAVPEAARPKAEAQRAQVYGLLAKPTAAKFWIDLREATGTDIVRRLVAEHGRPA